jgi:regulator of sirC expression with transglutaminase-like and TPR domain
MTPIYHPARLRFATLLRQPEAALELAEAALCIAWEDQGELDVGHYLGQLDRLADDARRVVRLRDARQAVASLNRYLFDELGFRGNTENYNDPRNSFLDQVLERRTGLPITLSLVYTEVARRLDLPIFGIGLPRHFIVRYTDGRDELFIDPFDGGRLWSRAECEEQIAAYGPAAAATVEALLQPATKRAILTRMLRNLKGVYLQRGDALPALAAIERILLIEPNEPSELRDRGMVRGRLGILAPALDDFERYATLVPRSPDLPTLRRQADALARLLGRRN